MLTRAIGEALFLGAGIWLIYLALEPHVRRRWPSVLISWSRVLAGNFRDPLVSRDFLFGALFGIWHAVTIFGIHVMNIRRGQRPEIDIEFDTMLGSRFAAGTVVSSSVTVVIWGLMYLLLIFLLRLICGSNWLTGIVFVLVSQVTSNWWQYSSPVLYAITSVLTTVILFIFIIRFGLFAAVGCFFVQDLLMFFPITTNISAWYAWSSWLAIFTILAWTIYAFHTSLGGQKVFAGKLLEE